MRSIFDIFQDLSINHAIAALPMINEVYLFSALLPIILDNICILYNNSKIGAQVRRDLGYMICLRIFLYKNI